jgi:transposase-like protein
MSDRTFTADEKNKLTQLINEGMRVLQEVSDLQEGLRDTVKAIAEELNVKPSLLSKAIKTAHKSSFTEQQSEMEDLETILITVGRKV